MPPEVLFGFTYAFAASVQPGPFQAYLLSHALAHGWRRTVPATAAPVVSDVPIVCLVLVLLTHVPPLMLHGLRVAGGVFLLVLARSAWRAWRDERSHSARPPAPIRQAFRRAVLVNLLNPNPYIGWATVMGPLLLRAWAASPVNAATLLTVFYGTMIVVTSSLVVLLGSTRTFAPRLARHLVGVSAFALAAFALWQLGSGALALARWGR